MLNVIVDKFRALPADVLHGVDPGQWEFSRAENASFDVIAEDGETTVPESVLASFRQCEVIRFSDKSDPDRAGLFFYQSSLMEKPEYSVSMLAQDLAATIRKFEQGLPV